ncbi:DUF3293 domain-containing protein [Vibrio japonicus]|uniref:DUF3293 domain-containing protein n=1 Tax=Vibrio japonicus TaxID=1824638 RepID=A0ABY5LJE4_9VIBR|nr:DUF3293 domain-containing protein [Vibrio japonicus]UUM31041.1 DUF3293 domain-containing protein [Vibrio japonicus]
MKIDAQLLAAYSDPYFRFRQKCTRDSFAIITAWNPSSKRLATNENKLKNKRLLQEINHNYFVEVLVGDKTFSWVEESFAVDISESEAINLARKFGQNAIYFVEGTRLYLVSCLEDKSKLELGEWRIRSRLKD